MDKFAIELTHDSLFKGETSACRSLGGACAFSYSAGVSVEHAGKHGDFPCVEAACHP